MALWAEEWMHAYHWGLFEHDNRFAGHRPMSMVTREELEDACLLVEMEVVKCWTWPSWVFLCLICLWDAVSKCSSSPLFSELSLYRVFELKRRLSKIQGEAPDEARSVGIAGGTMTDRAHAIKNVPPNVACNSHARCVHDH